ncbi:PTS glucose transporter subunit IIA [Alicyclobacillus pomorum]|jgi:sugar PTS system EIIA component|uniref:PTS sugar transporter subunit IIA n=1 Tax=Alicyclobacillus pomorum TaxID=204470 RepID=UPI0004058691|nr:PTS glucose transporter subunit IIA [Alicyclobacillus pomorum]
MAFWNRRSAKQTEEQAWLTVLAPVSGDVVRLNDVPDPVFAQRMVGDGAAVNPTSDTLVAPVDGTLTNLFPTGHAAGITTDQGMEVLIHIGMDTVELKGQGFEKLTEQGQRVTTGTALIRMDLETLRTTAKSVVTPVVVTNMAQIEELVITDQPHVEAGKDWLFKVKIKRG